MNLITQALEGTDASLREIPIRADRRTLAKRLWRAVADDGRSFGVQVESPLQDGDTVWQSERARYVIRQLAEPVLEIGLPASPEAAAAIAWTIGNLHFPVEVQPGLLRVPDDPALRAALKRSAIAYRPADAPFRPGAFAAAAAPHSHADGHDHAHDAHHHH